MSRCCLSTLKVAGRCLFGQEKMSTFCPCHSPARRSILTVPFPANVEIPRSPFRTDTPVTPRAAGQFFGLHRELSCPWGCPFYVSFVSALATQKYPSFFATSLMALFLGALEDAFSPQASRNPILPGPLPAAPGSGSVMCAVSTAPGPFFPSLVKESNNGVMGQFSLRFTLAHLFRLSLSQNL